MFVVTFKKDYLLDKSKKIMVVLTLKRASESPSVVLVISKKKVNNNDDFLAKTDMSVVVSLALTPA